MALRQLLIFVMLLATVPGFGQTPAPGGVAILTERYDHRRSGANLKESLLTPERIASDDTGKTRFGKVFTRSVDAAIYAQPLYLPGVTIPGKGRHNVVYVATANNTVYAFDADSCIGINAVPLWQQNLGPAVASARYTTVASIPLAYALRIALRLPLPEPFAAALDSIRLPYIGYYREIAPKIGIVGTPVIDPATRSLYVVAALSGLRDGTAVFEHRLFVLDTASGKVKRAGIPITGSVFGVGDGNTGQTLAFDSYFALQQSALLLDHGTLYIAFGTHGDQPLVGPMYSNGFLVNRYGTLQNLGGYAGAHGWLFAYDTRTLRQSGVFCTTPNARTTEPRTEDLLHLRLTNPVGAGINMGGVGPAADEKGNVYLVTGRGLFNRNDLTSGVEMPLTTEYGNSVLRLLLKGPLTPALETQRFSVTDYFTPSQQRRLSLTDNPSGGGGVILLPEGADGVPGSVQAITAALGNPVYLLDRNRLGGYVPKSDTRSFPTIAEARSFAGEARTVAPTPVCWPRTEGGMGTLVYLWTPGVGLQAWEVQNGALKPIAAPAPVATDDPIGDAPVNLSLSAKGGERESGILWAASPGSGSTPRFAAGVLRAFVAARFDSVNNQTVFRTLWSSDTDPTGVDAPGNLAATTAPLVANGRVYLPTTAGALAVYAMLSDRDTIPATAVTTIDSDMPTQNFERDPRMRIQGSLIGGIRRAGMVRFVVPDFKKENAPLSALLTLHVTPRAVEARENARSTGMTNLSLIGVENAGNWQPSEVTWDHLPGNNGGKGKSQVIPLTGAGHPVSLVAERAKVPLPVTFDVTRWVRAHPGQAVTFLLWSPNLQPVVFDARGKSAPFLTVNWQ